MSTYATAMVHKGKQLMTTTLTTPFPATTLAEALKMAPKDAMYLRGRRRDVGLESQNSMGNSMTTTSTKQFKPLEVTYGDLRRCAIDGARELASLLRLHELHGLNAEMTPATLAYATPPDGPGSAAAAVAFFAFAQIAAAAPFDAGTSINEAVDAFEQLKAATVVIWRDGQEYGIRKAAAQVGARLFEASLRGRPLGLFFDEIFSPPDGDDDDGSSLVASLRKGRWSSTSRRPTMEGLQDDYDDDTVDVDRRTCVTWGDESADDDVGLTMTKKESESKRGIDHVVIDVIKPPDHHLNRGLSAIPRPLSTPSKWMETADRAALLLRTSGTTSKPKIVALRDGQIVANGFLLGANLDLGPGDVCLNAMPLFHIGGLSASILATLATHGSVTCMAGAFTPELFAEHLGLETPVDLANDGGDVSPQGRPISRRRSSRAIQWPRPTWYSAVPTMHNAIVSYLERIAPHEDRDSTTHVKSNDDKMEKRHRIRFVRSGAAALSPYDARRLSAAFGGVPVIATYSMSEQMPISQPPFGFGRRQLDVKPGTVGLAVATSLAVVSENLEPIADPLWTTYTEDSPRASNIRVLQTSVMRTSSGQQRASLNRYRSSGRRRTGQIAISGPTVMREYVENPKATAASFFLLQGKWWFLTGDVGVLDDDGHLRLTGRSKELIKRGGEQISPYEVEDILMEHDRIKIAVVFAVPSELWGEEVGVAIVPSEPETVSRDDKRAWAAIVREAAGDGDLAPMKIPTKIVVCNEEDLPKTKTRKFIRTNLAEILLHISRDVQKVRVDKQESKIKKKEGLPTVSPALSGARYVLVLWTMYQHFGSNRSFGKWKRTRGYNLHMPMFFVLAGFQLASGMAAPATNLRFFSRSHRAYFWARFSAVHPLYLLSIFACALILLIGCRPSTYRQQFHWEAEKKNEDLWQWSRKEDDDGDMASHAFCEPTPANLGSWGATYTSTVGIFVLGLQAWPFAIPIAWWLSYYTWFQSVYYFCLFLFPFVYKKFYAHRGDKYFLGLAMIGLFLCNTFIVCGLYLINFMIWARGYEHSQPLALTLYLFPPFWTPYFFAGTAAAFLLDKYRPSDKVLARRRWGRTGDLVSIYFIVVVLALRASAYKISPHVTRHNKLLGRIWAYTFSRLHFPLVVAWVYAMAVGEGIVAKFLASDVLASKLGPLSFACYLFHQPVGALYFAVTRNAVWQWWRYRKFFYWFSPYPVPVPWYEAIWLMVQTTMVAKVLTDYVNPILVNAWNVTTRRIARCGSEEHDRADTLDTVCDVIFQLTGSDVAPDATLEQCGLASVGLPVLIRLLTSALPGLTINPADIINAGTLEEIATNIDIRLAHNDAAHIM